MSHFNAEMQKNQFRPELCPRPHGELSALPDRLAGFKGHTSKKGEQEGKEGKGRWTKSWFSSHHFMFKILKNTLQWWKFIYCVTLL